MRSIGILFFAFMIALIGIVGEHKDARSIQFNESSTLEILSGLSSEPLQSLADKVQQKQQHIAQSYIPFIILADFSLLNSQFDHYLSLYNLVRGKEYFLLI